MPYPATITEIESLAPEVVQLTVSLHDSGFVFSPGQWVNFRFPEGVSRAYTIASAPERPQAVQLCIRLGPGKGGAALRKLEAGAAVAIDGPHGSFVLPEGREGVVFLAGDVGIAPVRSIVLHMLATEDPRRITVLYEPDRRHILYAADFDPLARSGRIVHESGPIEALIERNRSRLEREVHAMAAGFDPFLGRVNDALRRLGFPPSRLISETFGPQP
jgi:ferredoxin-NADP reductase